MKKAKPQWCSRNIACPGPYLTLVFSQEELDRELYRLKIKEAVEWVRNAHSDASAHYFTAPDGKFCCIVALRGWEKRSGIELAGLLVHEAVHVWQVYAENIGETEPGKEQEPYAVQSIAQELMAEFARRTGGIGA